MYKSITDKFVGVLFCGGRGTRLGEIAKFVSKSFVPIYDRPVFRYGLDLLETCSAIDEIVILTNPENDEKLRKLGYQTIIQDDKRVSDMFTGWQFVRAVLKTEKHGVLVPSDNLANINLDRLIEVFLEKNADTAFSLFEVADHEKLAEMGVFDPETKSYFYKHPAPPTPFGVVAPFIIHNAIEAARGEEIIGNPNAAWQKHDGYWYDVGDYDSLVQASSFMQKRMKK